MTLKHTKTTTGYLVEGTDAVGKEVELFFNSWDVANYEQLVDVVDSFKKNELFNSERAKLPDPEKDLYVSIFGSDNPQVDDALHTTLVEAVEARNGIAVDWSQNPVTAVLRLIDEGQSHRLRLIAGNLVDMGPTQPAAGGPSVPTGDADSGDAVAYVGQGNAEFLG